MKVHVTYLGDPSSGDGPQVITAWGLSFAKGEAVPLSIETPAGETMLRKMRGNPHFKVVDADGQGAAIVEATKPPKRAKASKPVTDDAENTD
jgi:hypothetical protein